MYSYKMWSSVCLPGAVTPGRKAGKCEPWSQPGRHRTVHAAPQVQKGEHKRHNNKTL